ncbi:MAG: chromosome segregation protein SMC [Anaerolineae bacterium]|nr:chromosome segregation protein SMC [Anaerolineae bacterium]
MPPRLLSLELQGYKTFAVKNTFDFPANITAIVGPNGSGKSNIADSLRWVLGEQTFSLLRGRKTEDMIFSGSDKRPKASMAMATVNFDNSDGWLPIDYSIVSIARRAYRDGQNEYLLNNQRVRLKEISELLANSGLAERTYTIIGQGLVDTALSLKPDERRKFFEEAAGIGLYRSRKDEAENRLEATRRNIDRVQDILLELEPRLNSLEKQAVRAREYRRIQSELRLWLRDWYGYHWHKTQDELTHAKQVLTTQEERLEQARKHLMEVEHETSAIRETIQKLREQLSQWHSDLGGIHRERERVSRELAILEERQKSLNETLASSKSDFARIEHGLQAKRDRLDQLVKEISKVQAEGQEHQATFASIREKFQTQVGTKEKIEAVVRETRKELLAAESKQFQLSARLTEIKERYAGLGNSITNLRDELNAAGQEIDKITRSNQASEKQLGELEAKKEKLDLEIAKKQQEIDDHREKERRMTSEQAREQSNAAKLQARIEVIELAEQSLVGLAEGAKKFIDQLDKTKWSGKVIPLSKCITVQEGYEKCIAAALGDLLDGLVIESGLDLDSAFMIIKDNALSRVAIMEPQNINTAAGKNSRARKHDLILGEPVDFIQADETIIRMLTNILDRIYIVRDMKSARQVITQAQGGDRVITLDGDVMTANGWFLSGIDPRSTVISRPRELNKIREAFGHSQKELEQLNRKLDELKKTIDEGIVTLGNLKQGGEILQGEIKQARKEMQATQSSRMQMDQKRSILEHQLKDSEDQLSQLDDNEKSALEALRAVGQQVERLQTIEKENIEAIGELGSQELEQEMSHWETNLAVISQVINDLESRIDEQRGLIALDDAQMKALSERIQTSQTSLQEAHDERAHLREYEVDISQKINQLQAKIQPAEAELEQNEQLSINSQSNLLAAQQMVTNAERATSQAQMELIRQRDTLDNLRSKIEDDFGLVDLEYATEIEGPSPLPFDGLVEQFARVEQLPDDLDENISRLRGSLRRMGVVNLEAQAEYEQVKERFDFLSGQIADLRRADQDLRQIITELDDLMKVAFRKTFDIVAIEFKDMFMRLFGGGSARLILLDEEDPIGAGIEIEAKLPGRREQGLSLLSGGERSLTAVALIFSLLKVSPTPFCVLDEVDAMLDEANVGRFGDLLRELSSTTQFIIITHNRNTVQIADVIYGVTMGRDSVSQVISLRLDEVSDEMVA